MTEPSPSPAPAECEAIVRRLWDYLDGRLTLDSRDQVEAHLAVCAACPPHFAFAGRLRDALAARRTAQPEGGEERLRSRVRQALEAIVDRSAEERRDG